MYENITLYKISDTPLPSFTSADAVNSVLSNSSAMVYGLNSFAQLGAVGVKSCDSENGSP